jgi:hypothetical protein
MIHLVHTNTDGGGEEPMSDYDTDILAWSECQAGLLRRLSVLRDACVPSRLLTAIGPLQRGATLSGGLPALASTTGLVTGCGGCIPNGSIHNDLRSTDGRKRQTV